MIGRIGRGVDEAQTQADKEKNLKGNSKIREAEKHLYPNNQFMGQVFRLVYYP